MSPLVNHQTTLIRIRAINKRKLNYNNKKEFLIQLGLTDFFLFLLTILAGIC